MPASLTGFFAYNLSLARTRVGRTEQDGWLRATHPDLGVQKRVSRVVDPLSMSLHPLDSRQNHDKLPVMGIGINDLKSCFS